MFHNLNDTQVRLLLEKVAEKGMISMEPLINEVLENSPSLEVVTAAEVLHSLCCKDAHGDGEDGTCAYHQEAMFPETERLPYHKRWIHYTQSIVAKYEIAPEVLPILMPDIIKIYRTLKAIESVHGVSSLQLVTDILGDKLPPLPPIQTEL